MTIIVRLWSDFWSDYFPNLVCSLIWGSSSAHIRTADAKIAGVAKTGRAEDEDAPNVQIKLDLNKCNRIIYVNRITDKWNLQAEELKFPSVTYRRRSASRTGKDIKLTGCRQVRTEDRAAAAFLRESKARSIPKIRLNIESQYSVLVENKNVLIHLHVQTDKSWPQKVKGHPFGFSAGGVNMTWTDLCLQELDGPTCRHVWCVKALLSVYTRWPLLLLSGVRGQCTPAAREVSKAPVSVLEASERWRVLGSSDSRAFLLSKYLLFSVC